MDSYFGFFLFCGWSIDLRTFLCQSLVIKQSLRFLLNEYLKSQSFRQNLPLRAPTHTCTINYWEQLKIIGHDFWHKKINNVNYHLWFNSETQMWVSYHFRHADYWQSGCYKLSDWSGKQNCQYIFWMYLV